MADSQDRDVRRGLGRFLGRGLVAIVLGRFNPLPETGSILCAAFCAVASPSYARSTTGRRRRSISSALNRTTWEHEPEEPFQRWENIAPPCLLVIRRVGAEVG